ncbi:hypothetical protein AGMMS50276_00460 [Synergistales bacterium]|nr:hypothetical protein AGMMS50276_00460 [Synergistales bacterium]
MKKCYMKPSVFLFTQGRIIPLAAIAAAAVAAVSEVAAAAALGVAAGAAAATATNMVGSGKKITTRPIRRLEPIY